MLVRYGMCPARSKASQEQAGRGRQDELQGQRRAGRGRAKPGKQLQEKQGASQQSSLFGPAGNNIYIVGMV